MEVLGLLRPHLDLKEQEAKIKQFCKNKGFQSYITVFNSTNELSFVEDHKAIVFSSPEVLSNEERNSINDFARTKNIEVIYCS
ncbi:hypothetical protein [Paenibacillus periandrae]|uniref:hypothetical protein n=1 Tax=Paenibacillus periandrae TaxID=1761741 RepID=UPI001F089863|nr:hypothetical protein [Paenibacillus periandrae]